MRRIYTGRDASYSTLGSMEKRVDWRDTDFKLSTYLHENSKTDWAWNVWSGTAQCKPYFQTVYTTSVKEIDFRNGFSLKEEKEKIGSTQYDDNYFNFFKIEKYRKLLLPWKACTFVVVVSTCCVVHNEVLLIGII